MIIECNNFRCGFVMEEKSVIKDIIELIDKIKKWRVDYKM